MRVEPTVADTGEVVAIEGGRLELPGRVTVVGLDLPEGLTFDQWRGIGHSLQGVERSLMWWIGDWLRYGEKRYGESYTQAVEATGASYGSVRDAAWVAGAYPNLSDRSDKLTWTHHRFAASLPAEDRPRVLRLAEEHGWSVREMRAQVSRVKAAAKMLTGEPGNGTCTVADLYRLAETGARFGSIYADPPWLYDNQGTRAATGNHYGGLTVDELCALPVGELAADDAHLHLWTTNGFLFECPRIFEAWGFEFRSSFVWVKPQMGIGNYWRNSHEFLLTAVKGDAKRFNDKSLMSWLQCERGRHSAKPEMVRTFIERASPGPYLELFGRLPADGWTVWGDQIARSLLHPNLREVA